MGKIAFVLGIVGSLVTGLVLSGRLVHRDYSASIVNKLGTHTTCPTFWVSWDKPPDQVVPDGFLKCACPEQARGEVGGTPIHPPKEVHDAAAPMDVVTVSYTRFEPWIGERRVGLSYTLARGSDRQTFVILPASDPYFSFAWATSIPLVAGIVLGVLLGLIPKKESP